LEKLPDWLSLAKEDAMKENPNVVDRGARCGASIDITSAQSTNKVRPGSKRVNDVGANSGRTFHNRQARTDTVVRTIPGLHDFGN
jgi:hypothetical protein